MMKETIDSNRSELRPVVFVVDDDESMRKALSNLIRSVGLGVKCSHRLRSFGPSSCRRSPAALSWTYGCRA